MRNKLFLLGGKAIACLIFPMLALLNSAYASQCSINLNYGVIIDPKHIRIIEHGQTHVQINGSKQLFIQGREVTLDEKQQELLTQFSTGIREEVPEIVSLAIEAIDIGLKAVNEVIGGLTGENSASQQKVQAKFEELKWRIRARFNQSANNYFIAPQDFNDFDEMFTGEFEQEIEEIIQNSIGTLIEAVGQSLLNDSEHIESSGEPRITPFDERISSMSKGLELEVSKRAKALDLKADRFCQQLIELDKLEHQLHLSIEKLKPFNLIETQ